MNRRTIDLIGLIAIVLVVFSTYQLVGDMVYSAGYFVKARAVQVYALLTSDDHIDGRKDHDSDVSTLSPAERALQTDDLELQKAALYALAEASDDSVADVAVNAETFLLLETIALDPVQVELAQVAVHVLAEMGGAGALESLERILAESRHASVRAQAVYALTDCDDVQVVGDVASRIVRALINTIDNDPSASVRKAAVYALSDIDSPAASKALMEVVNSLGSS